MKVVIFGAGYWGRNYIREMGQHVVGVVEPYQPHANHAQSSFNVKVFPKLPDDLEFDGAVIATPPMCHAMLALPLLEKGKFVLIEKPMCTTTQEAIPLLKYPKTCMVAHIYLFNPMIDFLKNFAMTHQIDHGFSRRTNDGPIRSWQNAMWDLAPHDISIFNYIFGGMPISIESTGTRHWAMLNLEYPGGFSALSYVSWLGGPKVRTVELVSKDSHVRAIFDDMAVVHDRTPLQRMIEAFASGAWDRCTVDEGYNVVKVLSQASAGIHELNIEEDVA